MLAPFSIRWSLVEHPTNRGKLVDWGIFSWDAQLIQENSMKVATFLLKENEKRMQTVSVYKLLCTL